MRLDTTSKRVAMNIASSNPSSTMSVVQRAAGSYYHFLTEVLGRLLVLEELVLRPCGFKAGAGTASHGAMSVVSGVT